MRAAPVAWLKSPPSSGIISQVFRAPRLDHAVLQMALLLISCSRQIISWPAKIYVTRETFSRFISVTLRVIRFENKIKKKLWNIRTNTQIKLINMAFWNKTDNCDSHVQKTSSKTPLSYSCYFHTITHFLYKPFYRVPVPFLVFAYSRKDLLIADSDNHGRHVWKRAGVHSSPWSLLVK